MGEEMGMNSKVNEKSNDIEWVKFMVHSYDNKAIGRRIIRIPLQCSYDDLVCRIANKYKIKFNQICEIWCGKEEHLINDDKKINEIIREVQIREVQRGHLIFKTQGDIQREQQQHELEISADLNIRNEANLDGAELAIQPTPVRNEVIISDNTQNDVFIGNNTELSRDEDDIFSSLDTEICEFRLKNEFEKKHEIRMKNDELIVVLTERSNQIDLDRENVNLADGDGQNVLKTQEDIQLEQQPHELEMSADLNIRNEANLDRTELAIHSVPALNNVVISDNIELNQDEDEIFCSLDNAICGNIGDGFNLYISSSIKPEFNGQNIMVTGNCDNDRFCGIYDDLQISSGILEGTNGNINNYDGSHQPINTKLDIENGDNKWFKCIIIDIADSLNKIKINYDIDPMDEESNNLFLDKLIFRDNNCYNDNKLNNIKVAIEDEEDHDDNNNIFTMYREGIGVDLYYYIKSEATQNLLKNNCPISFVSKISLIYIECGILLNINNDTLFTNILYSAILRFIIKYGLKYKNSNKHNFMMDLLDDILADFPESINIVFKEGIVDNLCDIICESYIGCNSDLFRVSSHSKHGSYDSICDLSENLLSSDSIDIELSEPDETELYENDVLNNIRNLVNDESLNGVIFIVENEKLYGIRSLFASQSIVFKNMLYGQMMELNLSNEVILNDLTIHTFKYLRNIFYNILDGESAGSQLTPSMVVNVLFAAQKYLIQPLIIKCIIYIQQIEKVDDWYQILLGFEKSTFQYQSKLYLDRKLYLDPTTLEIPTSDPTSAQEPTTLIYTKCVLHLGINTNTLIVQIGYQYNECWMGLYLYLGHLINDTLDKEIIYKYIITATECNQFEQIRNGPLQINTNPLQQTYDQLQNRAIQELNNEIIRLKQIIIDNDEEINKLKEITNEGILQKKLANILEENNNLKLEKKEYKKNEEEIDILPVVTMSDFLRWGGYENSTANGPNRVVSNRDPSSFQIGTMDLLSLIWDSTDYGPSDEVTSYPSFKDPEELELLHSEFISRDGGVPHNESSHNRSIISSDGGVSHNESPLHSTPISEIKQLNVNNLDKVLKVLDIEPNAIVDSVKDQSLEYDPEIDILTLLLYGDLEEFNNYSFGNDLIVRESPLFLLSDDYDLPKIWNPTDYGQNDEIAYTIFTEWELSSGPKPRTSIISEIKQLNINKVSKVLDADTKQNLVYKRLEEIYQNICYYVLLSLLKILNIINNPRCKDINRCYDDQLISINDKHLLREIIHNDINSDNKMVKYTENIVIKAIKTFCIDDKYENYILRELKQWILSNINNISAESSEIRDNEYNEYNHDSNYGMDLLLQSIIDRLEQYDIEIFLCLNKNESDIKITKNTLFAYEEKCKLEIDNKYNETTQELQILYHRAFSTTDELQIIVVSIADNKDDIGDIDMIKCIEIISDSMKDNKQKRKILNKLLIEVMSKYYFEMKTIEKIFKNIIENWSNKIYSLQDKLHDVQLQLIRDKETNISLSYFIEIPIIGFILFPLLLQFCSENLILNNIIIYDDIFFSKCLFSLAANGTINGYKFAENTDSENKEDRNKENDDIPLSNYSIFRILTYNKLMGIPSNGDRFFFTLSQNYNLWIITILHSLNNRDLYKVFDDELLTIFTQIISALNVGKIALCLGIKYINNTLIELSIFEAINGYDANINNIRGNKHHKLLFILLEIDFRNEWELNVFVQKTNNNKLRHLNINCCDLLEIIIKKDENIGNYMDEYKCSYLQILNGNQSNLHNRYQPQYDILKLKNSKHIKLGMKLLQFIYDRIQINDRWTKEELLKLLKLLIDPIFSVNAMKQFIVNNGWQILINLTKCLLSIYDAQFIYVMISFCINSKIKIYSAQIHNLSDKRIIVNIDDCNRSDKYPNGHYTKTIGIIGDLETEAQVLLIEHDLSYNPWLLWKDLHCKFNQLLQYQALWVLNKFTFSLNININKQILPQIIESKNITSNSLIEEYIEEILSNINHYLYDGQVISFGNSSNFDIYRKYSIYIGVSILSLIAIIIIISTFFNSVLSIILIFGMLLIWIISFYQFAASVFASDPCDNSQQSILCGVNITNNYIDDTVINIIEYYYNLVQELGIN